MNNKISRSNIAAVIFDNKSRVLLCKRSMSKKIAPGLWRLPGGEIEESETLEDALRREIHEELSVEIISIKEIGIKDVYKVAGDTHQTQYAQATIKGAIKLNYENDDYAFVNPNDIDKYIEDDALDINRKVIERALKFYQS